MSREKKLEKLVVELEARTAKYKADLDRARQKTRTFSKSAKRDLIDVRQAFGLLGAGLAIKEVIAATSKQERAVKQLEQGIRTTAGAAGFAAKELQTYASELQGVTTFGDEDIITAMSQLVTFTSITGDEFKRTTEAALDLASRFDGDLKSATVQLGKALNDPIANLSALSRAGIQFSTDQKEVIQSMVESGRLADAQRLILEELETQFGGSARAARDTFGGAIQALNNAFGDLLESDTGLNAAKESIENLTATLSDPGVKEGVQQLAGAIISGFAGAAEMVSTVINAVRFLAEEFAAWVYGPAIGDIPRIEEELSDVESRIKSLNETIERGSRSNAPQRELDSLLARKKVLENLLALSRENQRTVIDSGGDVDIRDPGNPPELDFFEKWADRYEELAKDPASRIEKAWLDSLDNITVSMSNMLAQAIIEGENLRDVFSQVAKTIGVQLLSSLIQVGVQMGVNRLFAAKNQQQMAALTLGQAKALSVAWAPAAAGASLATAGANVAPAEAAMFSAYGTANALALSGMAHDGISSIPSEGTWLLDKGERVLSAGQNQDLKSFMSGSGGKGIEITNVYQINSNDEAAVKRAIASMLPMIERNTVRSVEAGLRKGGSLSRAAGTR